VFWAGTRTSVRRRGQDGAAGETDEDQRQHVEQEHPPEPRQQLRAPLGAHADLKQRAVAEPDRRHFEDHSLLSGIERAPRLLPVGGGDREARQIELAPLVRPAQERHDLPGADRAHQ
jgi:hypothetical protein